jgi:hypothetical protein
MSSPGEPADVRSPPRSRTRSEQLVEALTRGPLTFREAHQQFNVTVDEFVKAADEAVIALKAATAVSQAQAAAAQAEARARVAAAQAEARARVAAAQAEARARVAAAEAATAETIVRMRLWKLAYMPHSLTSSECLAVIPNMIAFDATRATEAEVKFVRGFVNLMCQGTLSGEPEAQRMVTALFRACAIVLLRRGHRPPYVLDTSQGGLCGVGWRPDVVLSRSTIGHPFAVFAVGEFKAGSEHSSADTPLWRRLTEICNLTKNFHNELLGFVANKDIISFYRLICPPKLESYHDESKKTKYPFYDNEKVLRQQTIEAVLAFMSLDDSDRSSITNSTATITLQTGTDEKAEVISRGDLVIKQFTPAQQSAFELECSILKTLCDAKGWLSWYTFAPKTIPGVERPLQIESKPARLPCTLRTENQFQAAQKQLHDQLSVAHREGIVHGDIALGNIIAYASHRKARQPPPEALDDAVATTYLAEIAEEEYEWGYLIIDWGEAETLQQATQPSQTTTGIQRKVTTFFAHPDRLKKRDPTNEERMAWDVYALNCTLVYSYLLSTHRWRERDILEQLKTVATRRSAKTVSPQKFAGSPANS